MGDGGAFFNCRSPSGALLTMTRAGPQQAAVQGIAFLDDRQHRIGRLVPALLGHHGLMPLRIERLARRVDDLDAGLIEGAVQFLQGGLRTLQQGRSGVRRAGY